MTHHLFRWTLMGLVGLASTTLGCTRWIDVIPSSTLQQESITRSISNDERVPLVMDGFRMTQNGAPQNPSTEIERHILNTVQETRLFSTLVPLGGNVDSLGNKVVTARIPESPSMKRSSLILEKQPGRGLSSERLCFSSRQ